MKDEDDKPAQERRQSRGRRKTDKAPIRVGAVSGNGFLAQIAVVIVAVFMIMGINGKVESLEQRADKLEREVETVENVRAEIKRLQREANNLQRAQNDILDVIEQAIARRPRR